MPSSVVRITEKKFSSLSLKGQVSRLRSAAEEALRQFGLEGRPFRLLNHGENATFRVRGRGGGGGGDRVLRIHRPSYHSTEEIRSELAWMRALSSEMGGALPNPVPARDGALLVEVDSPRLPERRVCSLVTWLQGRHRLKATHEADFRGVGELMARLHRHALKWAPPHWFRRPTWDWKGLLQEGGNWGKMKGRLIQLFSAEDQPVVREALALIRDSLGSLSRRPGSHTLIHADLHFGNILFRGDEAMALDFDDCGQGPLVYDAAVVLTPFVGSRHFPAYRDALLDGYTEIRLFPRKDLLHLPEMVLARRLTMAIWLSVQSELNPRFRCDLRPYLEKAAGLCRRILGGSRLEDLRKAHDPS